MSCFRLIQDKDDYIDTRELAAIVRDFQDYGGVLDGNKDGLISTSEWLTYLTHYKSKEGLSKFHSFLSLIEAHLVQAMLTLTVTSCP